MPLKAGEIAPHFLMKDTSGQMIDLAHYRGSRTMLSFFRYTGCPLCNLRFWYLTQRYPHYRAQGLRIISVFESSQADTRDFASKFASPFPIIADPKRELYKLYKLETSWTGFVRGFLLRGAAFEEAQSRGLAKWNINGTAQRMPADFLLNPDQTIATAYYGKDMGDFLQLTKSMISSANQPRYSISRTSVISLFLSNMTSVMLLHMLLICIWKHHRRVRHPATDRHVRRRTTRTA